MARIAAGLLNHAQKLVSNDVDVWQRENA